MAVLNPTAAGGGASAAPTGPTVTVAIISMSGAAERRARMREQMTAVPAPWRFVDAHTAPDPELTLHERSWPRINGRVLNKAEVGCYSSHYSLWREHAQAADDDLLLVLEDDAILDTDYLADLGPLREVAARFGYVRFHCHMIAPAQTLFYQDRRRVIRFKRRVHGTLAYCIDARTARIFADRLRDLRRPVDVEMDRYWEHGVPIFCLYPFVAIERAAPTQIEGRVVDPGSTLDHLLWKINNQVDKLRCWSTEARYRVRGRKAFGRDRGN